MDEDDEDEDEDDEELPEASTSSRKKKSEREIELELGDDYILGKHTTEKIHYEKFLEISRPGVSNTTRLDCI